MNPCRTAALAASISLALASTAAFAAPPTATQLPGQGAVDPHSPTATTGPVTIDAGTSTMTVPLTGNTVIDWGASGGTINSTGTAGFDIGQSATVDFTGNYGVLNVDVTSNPSQIYGTLSGAGSVFVANANGIIVGPNASIASTGGAVGLIANTLGANQSGFNGAPGSVVYDTTGGNVTVMTGAAVGGSGATSVLISGGGTVNVDLGKVSAASSGAITLQAGIDGGASPASTPAGASLAVTGNNTGDVIFQSAGNASSSGTLTLDPASTVAGTLTNTGAMTLNGAFAIAGALVNDHATMTAGDSVTAGSFANSGTFDGYAGSPITTTAAGGLTNSGQLINVGNISVTNGSLANTGTISAMNVAVTGGNLTNQGTISNAGNASVAVTGGNLTNGGSITALGITGTNGSITNSGTLTVGTDGVQTQSYTSQPGFAAGAAYSITNSGTIVSTAGGSGLTIDANDALNQNNAIGPGGNGSTGSFINTGVLQVGPAGSAFGLQATAGGNVTLGGRLQFTGGQSPSTASPLGLVTVQSSGTTGTVTVATPIVSNSNVTVSGNQVAVMASIAATGGDVAIDGGNKPASYTGSNPASDYAIRIGNGVTVSGSTVFLEGINAGDAGATSPNAILQGTVSGGTVNFSGVDLFSGPNGRIVATGATPTVNLTFTGVVKTVPYNNDPNNFRFNDLPILDSGTGPLTLVLNPVAFQTNGTSNGKSAVNILVDGSVNVSQTATAAAGFTPTPANGTATTGAVNLPNTHLVLQASGNITTPTGVFYWPGYVYLGTIASDASGNPLPGTLGTGTINLANGLNNVLPGDVAGASGIHFITNMPLLMATGADVVTNANAWINFGTDALTTKYSSANGASGPFFGGTANSNVVTYGPLAPANFVTQPPDPNR